MFDLKIIGENIKYIREQRKLTQTQVAEYLGVDQSLLSKIEKGERSISADDIEKIADLFCCSVAALLEKDININTCKISFRSNKLDNEDFERLAVINRIVRNQFDMNKIGE